MYTISLYWNKVFKLNSEHNVQILEILTIGQASFDFCIQLYLAIFCDKMGPFEPAIDEF